MGATHVQPSASEEHGSDEEGDPGDIIGDTERGPYGGEKRKNPGVVTGGKPREPRVKGGDGDGPHDKEDNVGDDGDP